MLSPTPTVFGAALPRSTLQSLCCTEPWESVVGYFRGVCSVQQGSHSVPQSSSLVDHRQYQRCCDWASQCWCTGWMSTVGYSRMSGVKHDKVCRNTEWMKPFRNHRWWLLGMLWLQCYKHCGGDLTRTGMGCCSAVWRYTTSTFKHRSQTRPRGPSWAWWEEPPTFILNNVGMTLVPIIVTPTFSLLWSDPASALCPGSFAGWRGCRPVWILGRFWCKGPA